MAVIALFAVIGVKASTSASNSITITNKLTKTFLITVSFAQNAEDAKPTRPIRKQIKRNQAITFEQPLDKNFVFVVICNDSACDAPKTKSSFKLTDTVFQGKRDITIEGDSTNPKLWINSLALTAQP